MRLENITLDEISNSKAWGGYGSYTPRTPRGLSLDSHEGSYLDKYILQTSVKEIEMTEQQKEFIKDPAKADVAALLEAEANEKEAEQLYNNLRVFYKEFKSTVNNYKEMITEYTKALEKAQNKLDKFFELAKSDPKAAINFNSYKDIV